MKSEGGNPVQVDGEGLCHLAHAMPDLQVLLLDRCRSVLSTAGLKSLSALSNLRRLGLAQVHIGCRGTNSPCTV